MDEAHTIRVEDWRGAEGQLVAAETAERGQSIRRWLLSAVPNDVANSLTEAQLSAVAQAIVKRPTGRFPVNIRLSVPFLHRRVFIVLLAGPERRSRERLQRERFKHTLWSLTNVCAIAFGLIFLVPALLGLVHMIILAFAGN